MVAGVDDGSKNRFSGDGDGDDPRKAHELAVSSAFCNANNQFIMDLIISKYPDMNRRINITSSVMFPRDIQLDTEVYVLTWSECKKSFDNHASEIGVEVV